jgi:hypothetical protein
MQIEFIEDRTASNASISKKSTCPRRFECKIFAGYYGIEMN